MTNESRDLEEYLAVQGHQPTLAPSDSNGEATEAKVSPGSSRSLPAIIDEAVRKGIRVMLTPSGYELDGFYRGGPMRVEPGEEGTMIAIDKKEKQTVLSTFDDLVRLNYDWWKMSRDKRADWVNPGKEWIEEFGRLNLVKRQVMFIPGDD